MSRQIYLSLMLERRAKQEGLSLDEIGSARLFPLVPIRSNSRFDLLQLAKPPHSRSTYRASFASAEAPTMESLRQDSSENSS